MSTPILATKLYIPAPRAKIVGRPHLIERLNAGIQGKLTLISAPAGFGKTTLISEWISSLGHSVVWLSLDERDRDPTRFLTYLVAALQTIQPEIGKTVMGMLQSPQPPPIETLLTSLLNEISTLSDKLMLVLDDYHVLDAEPIDEAMRFLLEHLPPQLQLIITTRTDPNLPLARYRARGQLTEIRRTDLSFSPTETTEFLNQTMGLNLSGDDIIALETHTEGWVAGLQMAALALQGQSAKSRKDNATFIRDFGGRHRFVLDYLVEEVLQNQPNDVQHFLLQTAILERLSGPLCDAVTGQKNGQAMLARLERHNLFVVPLDDERNWFRYHHLFAESLSKRLPEQFDLSEQQYFYRQATLWCDKQGLDNETIRYALQSGDEALTLAVAEKYVRISLHRSELNRILHWLQALAEAGIALTLPLQILSAWTMLFSGQIEKLMSQLTLLESLSASPEGADRTVGNVLAIRGWLALFRGDFDQTAKLTSQALEKLPTTDLPVRGNCFLNLGNANLRLGNLKAAIEGFTAALTTSQQSGAMITEVFARTYLATAMFHQGKLHAAEEGYRQVINLAVEHHQQYSPATAVAYLGLSELLREWYHLDKAAELIEQAITLFQQTQNGPMLIQALPAQVHIQIALGNLDAAQDTLNRSAEVMRRMGHTQTPESHAAHQAYLDLLNGNQAAAYQWAGSQTPPDQTMFDEPVWTRDHYHHILTLGAIWSIENSTQAKRALALLIQTKETAQRNGFFGIALEAILLQAVAWQTMGDQETALTHLETALAYAEPEGYVYSFVKVRTPMQRLLRLALRRNLFPPFVQQLLATFPPDQPTQSLGITHISQSLAEPLSERELEVLALLADGYSNAQIAEELIITVGTTKRHVSNIFGKLRVGSRTQAVAQGREIGLI
ncbi:MAG: LuxR C-terminal-related transcriptional regulator [Chloroflexota bacterium]